MTGDPLRVPCRYCAAPIHQPCINRARDGDPPLQFAPAHPIRLTESGFYIDEELF